MQSKLQSFVEAVAQTIIGYAIALATQYLIFPLYGIHIQHSAHIQISAVFVGVSLVRGYFLRRAFNRLHAYQKGARA